MIETSRRSFLGGLAFLAAAPAIVRIDNIMPVRSLTCLEPNAMAGDLQWSAFNARVQTFDGKHWEDLPQGLSGDDFNAAVMRAMSNLSKRILSRIEDNLLNGEPAEKREIESALRLLATGRIGAARWR